MLTIKIEMQQTDDGVLMKNVTEATVKEILAEREQLISDMRSLKNNLFTALQKLNIMNEDGVMREKPNMTLLIPKVMGYMTNSNKFSEDFGFISELMPMLSRYENL